MKSILRFLKRNFGHVYLRDEYRPDVLCRFRAKRGRVALLWYTPLGVIPFKCRLGKNGELINDCKGTRGYGKPYSGWSWMYFVPMGFPLENIRNGGAW